jgi:hypothetical protein
LHEKEEISEEDLNKKLGISIKCGILSYAELAK